MANDSKDAKPKSGEQAAADKPKPRKTLPKSAIIIGVITVAQAAGFYTATRLLGGAPQIAHGSEVGANYLQGGDPDATPSTVEIVLVEGFKVPNGRSGRTYIYDFDVSIKAPSHRQEEAAALVASRKGEIGDRLARIVRGADPAVLQEPELKTLREQVRQVLGEIAGDPDLVMEVFIPRCVPIRTD